MIRLRGLLIVAAFTAGLFATALTASAATPAAPASGPPLETIVMPTNGTTVVSVHTLQAGSVYRIQASGTFYIGAALPVGDAEYAQNPTTHQVELHCSNSPLGVALGIAIDDATVGRVKFPYWGRFTSTHVYTIAFVGLGAPISLNYHDCNYADNVGTLTVQIFGPA
jgi:hypothetical protein